MRTYLPSNWGTQSSVSFCGTGFSGAAPTVGSGGAGVSTAAVGGSLAGVRPIRLVRSHQSIEKLQTALPGPPAYSTSDGNWKEQVREALGGHRLEVAFDAIGGKVIDDLASVVDGGGTVINYGSLGSNTGTNIYSLAPNNVALKSVHIMNWFRLTQEEKQKDFELALSLATNHSELFEVGHEYDFADLQKAIQHVSTPGRTGIVLLRNRA